MLANHVVVVDTRLVALGDMLAVVERDARRLDGGVADAVLSAVADLYAIAYGYGGALDAPVEAMPARMARAIRRAAGDDVAPLAIREGGGRTCRS